MKLCVMAPLLMQNDRDWMLFVNSLRTLQQAIALKVRRPGSVSLGVSSDVWWGLVQRSNANEWNWAYYDRLAWTLFCLNRERPNLPELHWAPIMSFHQCGGNVGDSVNIPIPGWAVKNREYVSEKGNACREYVSLWHDEAVIPYYKKFINAFARRYSGAFLSMHNNQNCRAPEICELNISCGPAGELRFPSYNSHDRWAYPHYGFGQGGSYDAWLDYEAYLWRRYSGRPYYGPRQSSAGLMSDSRYYTSDEGRDFFEWYNHALIKHGQRMIQAGLDGLDGTPLFKVRIGVKIPGIHWNSASNRARPRSGEVLAGLIDPSCSSMEYGQPYLTDGYLKMLWALVRPQDMKLSYRASSGRSHSIGRGGREPNDLYLEGGYKLPVMAGAGRREKLDLTIHFTCAEMPEQVRSEKLPYNPELEPWNKHEPAGWGKMVVDPFSRPQALVTHVAWCGNMLPEGDGLELGIENALAHFPRHYWNNIFKAVSKENYGKTFYEGKTGIPYQNINILRLDTAAENSDLFASLIKI
ncbi:family 14 glycosylhydrolase [Lentisphaerota bacterium ZTH]|nr:family 14 glycosylhydrolase [Lentisphaerota bacterium]WET05957.1 family 14 glycosylhydrolase [Lentisphaerota bacterium ZTH]